MMVTEQPSGRIPVFVDASVWIAAAASPMGGSSLVLEVCRGKRFAAICSQRVLLEAQQNIRDKMTTHEMVRFYQLLAAASSSQVSPVNAEAEAQYAEIVGLKDAHVVAAAIHSSAAFLVTLDRKHLANDRVRTAGLPLEVLTPGEFIRLVLTEHPAP
jgi:putative PIN family toxin of toxin-antitoxin system